MENYTAKKLMNQGVQGMIVKHLTPKGAERFRRCGNWIEFFECKDAAKRKVHDAEFCKHRFCPMCMWRLAHKDALRIAVLMDCLEAEARRAFVFATFTAPNVRAEGLPGEISRFNKAYKELMRRPEIERMNDGYVRKLEVTYNGSPTVTEGYYLKAKAHCDEKGLKPGDPNPNYDTYHAHFHCIYSVARGYFSGGRYLKRDRWLELWQGVMGDRSITQLDVRRVKRGDRDCVAGALDSKGALAEGRAAPRGDRAFLEIAKYAAKNFDFTHSQEVFDVFYGALRGRQLLTYGGSFAEASRRYKAGELEGYKTHDLTEYVSLALYKWAAGYKEARRRVLHEGEYRVLKKEALDDSPM